MRNVVQAEFFHVGGAASLGEHLAEMGNRIADSLELCLLPDAPGPGLKTVVRFHDTTGSVTEHAQQLEWLKNERDRLIQKPCIAQWLRVVWRNIQINTLSRKIEKRAPALRLRVLAGLEGAIRAGRPVAIEVMDHSFRPLRQNETHELLESVRRAKGLWIFVFAPNGLLADENKVIVSVI